MTEEICRFLFEWPVIAVLAMMSRLVTIGFSLLVEMEIDGEVIPDHFRVGVEAGISGACEGADEAHFFAILALEGIARAPEYRDGIVGWFGEDDFHRSGGRKMFGHQA